MAFLHGLGLGLSTALILGPVFFTLLRNAMLKGWKAGLATALGIVVSDVVVLLICYYLAEVYIQQIIHEPVAHYIAAIVLFAVGLSFMLKKMTEVKEGENTERYIHLGSFIQGFVVNFINPFVFAIWLGFIAIAKGKEYSDNMTFTFFVAILLGVFLTDTLKAVFAPKIKAWIQASYLQWIYRLIGFILILAALRILWMQLA